MSSSFLSEHDLPKLLLAVRGIGAFLFASGGAIACAVGPWLGAPMIALFAFPISMIGMLFACAGLVGMCVGTVRSLVASVFAAVAMSTSWLSGIAIAHDVLLRISRDQTTLGDSAGEFALPLAIGLAAGLLASLAFHLSNDRPQWTKFSVGALASIIPLGTAAYFVMFAEALGIPLSA